MLFVFDLDFTLWDCGGTWCDCTHPPYRKENGKVLDRSGRHIVLYPDVAAILNTLTRQGHQLAAASRTHEPSWADQLLKLLEVDHLFQYKEIYPGPKLPHFRSLKKRSGLAYENMVFFDDEERNIADIGPLGVRAVYVRMGLDWSHVKPFLKAGHKPVSLKSPVEESSDRKNYES